MTYEERMKIVNACRPEKKDQMLLRLIKGETIDITKDEDLFFQVNKDRMSLEDFTNRDKFKNTAAATKFGKQGMYDVKHGRSKNKKMRWLGDIPAEIYFSRPEFSPLLPKVERDRNIRKWLNSFPVFKAPEGTV